MPLIDRSKVWTGKINEIVLPKPTQTSVRFYDTTLRDGEQSVGVIFDPDQKLEIARLLDDMGIDRIEAGFPRVSDEDNKAIAQIAAAGLKAEIWGFARAIVKDVDAVVFHEWGYLDSDEVAESSSINIAFATRLKIR